MKVIETVREFRKLRQEWRDREESVGFVPTMGALHAGHLSLLDFARKDNRRVVASIFVNPTQFNDAKDLETYPQPRAQDLALLEAAGLDAVFLPQPKEMYADNYRFEVSEKEFSQVLCGPRRPGHFTGVLTVVLKLFNITQPDRAYFGEKDYQQLRLIRDMSESLFLDTQVIGCPTLREADGLAMSSRNLRLTPEQRELAPVLYRILQSAPDVQTAAQEMTEAGFRVEYVEEHWGRRFVAAHLGSVRLIDNVELK